MGDRLRACIAPRYVTNQSINQNEFI